MKSENIIVGRNKELLRLYAGIIEDGYLATALANTNGNIVHLDFRTMEWDKTQHDEYAKVIEKDLGSAVVIDNTDWMVDGPTRSRGTCIEIDLRSSEMSGKIKDILSKQNENKQWGDLTAKKLGVEQGR